MGGLRGRATGRGCRWRCGFWRWPILSLWRDVSRRDRRLRCRGLGWRLGVARDLRVSRFRLWFRLRLSRCLYRSLCLRLPGVRLWLLCLCLSLSLSLRLQVCLRR